jgi:hypothetical protein
VTTAEVDALVRRANAAGFNSVAEYAANLEEAIKEMVAQPEVGVRYEQAVWRVAYRALNGREAT